MTPAQRDSILKQYRGGLAALLGSELDAVMLYGSQARGDAADDSDIDVLCIMKGPFDYGDMIALTSELTARLSLEHGITLSRSFVTRGEYESGQTPFLMNVRKDGVLV